MEGKCSKRIIYGMKMIKEDYIWNENAPRVIFME